ncbi:DNA methyltransferase, partial [Candidatus Poribacteria bacterium]|nr:DNA methyltransferase [Candidatus Poribacteria bacterium]
TYSPAYLSENADGIRQDWPRIPLPGTEALLRKSAGLGRRVAALLDTERGVEGVTGGRIEERYKRLGILRRVGGGALNPDAGERAITAGWGRAGGNGACMPGKGRMEMHAAEESSLNGPSGAPECDVYLNQAAYWTNIPMPVWEFTIGGYQVLKKWLSYREASVLGRALTVDEADYVTAMIRRLAALVELGLELDANYTEVADGAHAWPEP